MTRKMSSMSAALIRAFALGLLSAILAGPPAFAGSLGMVAPDRWRPHADVGVLDRVTLRMHWYDSLEQLRDAAVEHDVADEGLHGFSILSRNTQSGEWFCDVFVVKMRGALVDNDRTVTFGHEALHCVGLRHD
ncbi:MAG TPA: hypothetical protein VF405_13060 [Gammaproteobacteria bacterium]